jgi:alpha 1,2-mannosyltransferase
MSAYQPNGFRTIGIDLDNSAIRELRKYWKEYLRDIPQYPGSFSGRGIVISAGGLRYFTCVWITIRMLRRQGCTLPIELWYAGNELSEEVIDEIKALNVTARNFLDNGSTQLTGFMLKPLSILLSSFREILFVDADNLAFGNPECLFEAEEYKKYGAIFWPDLWKTPPENPIWAITGNAYVLCNEQESGQLLVDKERCWRELHLCLHFNLLGNIYHQLLMGDKDTFRFAWMTLRTPFYMIPTEPAICGYYEEDKFLGTTMIQHDFDGKYYFVHRNLLKWDITRKKEKVWKEIKSFTSGSISKEYLFGYSSNGHYYIDLQGDIERFEFSGFFGELEAVCLQFLEELRSSPFYQRFIEYSHFATHRYSRETAFSLENL